MPPTAELEPHPRDQVLHLLETTPKIMWESTSSNRAPGTPVLTARAENPWVSSVLQQGVISVLKLTPCPQQG